MKARLLLLVLLTIALPTAAAQVYSWTDANGVKHFSDSPPPPSVTAQKIKVRGGVTSDDGTITPVPDPNAKPADPAPTNTAQAANKPLIDSPENRAKQCQMAKSNLDLLKSEYQVSAPVGDDGKTAVLDDAGRKQAIDRAADQVAFYCK